MKPYFAYGSNLNSLDLKRWCEMKKRPYPLGKSLGKAFLPDAELAFNAYSIGRKGGVCSPRELIGHVLPGALYEVPSGLEKVLDAKEGAPRFYERIESEVFLEDGRRMPCFTYRIKKEQLPFVPPHPEYVRVVEEGLRSVGQTTDHLASSVAGHTGMPLIRLLFCYGSLMNGESRHGLIEGDTAKFISGATVGGRLLDLGAYPGLVPMEGSNSLVYGELYEIRDPQSLLSSLDLVEGFLGYGKQGSLFNRILTIVRWGGATGLAWTYGWNGSTDGDWISHGDWRLRKGPRDNA